MKFPFPISYYEQSQNLVEYFDFATVHWIWVRAKKIDRFFCYCVKPKLIEQITKRKYKQARKNRGGFLFPMSQLHPQYTPPSRRDFDQIKNIENYKFVD